MKTSIDRIVHAARRALAASALALGALAAATPSLAPTALANGWDAASQAHYNAEETLVLHIGKARAITLPRPARDILVSDPKVVDTVLRTAQQPVLFGLRIGQANILFYDENNNEIREIELRVEYDTTMLNQMITDHFPTAAVRARSILGDVVLDGATRTSVDAAAIASMAERFIAAARSSQSDSGEPIAVDPENSGVVNRIAVLNEEQIHLKVRVAEVNRSVLKRLGVDWNAGLQSAAVSSVIDVNNFPIDRLLQGSGTTVSFGPQLLDALVKALEQHQLVKTLAEPSLTAVSGESAAFLAGGEFPIPVASEDNTITIEFKSFGVSLDFTPVVVGEGRISLKIATEVSELSENGAININGLVIPALSLRRADTTLEVGSGSTIVMAGLIQQNTRRLSAGLPGLRELPVLGQFFRNEQTEIDETELVVLVTPYTVELGAPGDFQTPLDGFAPASDLDMYLFGRLHSVYGAGPERAERIRERSLAIRAPVGFMME